MICCQRGTLVRNTANGEVTVSLGPVGSLAALAWPVEHKHLKKGFPLYFLGGSNHMSKMPWLVVLELDSYEVLPSKVVAPVQAFMLQGRSVSGPTGLCLQQTGPSMSMLAFAAGPAFWDWGKALLERLATLRGVDVDPLATALSLCVALITNILGALSQEELDQILANRTKVLGNLTPQDFLVEVVKEVMGEKDAKLVEDPSVRECFPGSACEFHMCTF